MKNEQSRIYVIEIILVIALITCTLFKLVNNYIFTALLTLVAAIAINTIIKRKKTLKANRKQILKIMIIFGILYVSLFYMLGLYRGFIDNQYEFNIKTLFQNIIPIIIILLATEIIREKLLLNNQKKSKALVTIIGTIIDISLYLNMYKMNSLYTFLAITGFVCFSAIANNLLYTYLSEKYGKQPVIAYKLLTTMYMFVLPKIPNVYILFRTFVRLIYPLLIYSYLEKYFNMDKARESNKDMRKEIITLATGSAVIFGVIALISCKFYYGILVIGSKSMTQSINEGDVVFFQGEKDDIEKDDVIVFRKDNIRVVHRVTKVKNINNEFRYYTKGDANPLPDEGYITKDEIIGKVLYRIKNIGKPTLWLKKAFDKEG